MNYVYNNFISMQLYSVLDVDLVIVQSITWNQGDQIGVSSNSDTTLDNLVDFRGSMTTPHDNLHLLT